MFEPFTKTKSLIIKTFSLCLLFLPTGANEAVSQPIADVTPINHFYTEQPAQKKFGKLEFSGGVIIEPRHKDLGGISGLRIINDNQDFVAVTDAGDWLSGRLAYTNGLLTDLDSLKIGPIRGAPGETLNGKLDNDAEGIGILADGRLLVSFERNHRLAIYDFQRSKEKSRAQYLSNPKSFSRMLKNKGVEAVAVFPDTSTKAGQIIAFSERLLFKDLLHTGWIINGKKSQHIYLKRSEGFDVTDLDFLPNGDLLILERRYWPLFGVAIRIKQIAKEDLEPGAVLEGDIILQADSDYMIDNLEGMSVHKGPEGHTRITLVSDDNFNKDQQTLFLQFIYNDQSIQN